MKAFDHTPNCETLVRRISYYEMRLFVKVLGAVVSDGFLRGYQPFFFLSKRHMLRSFDTLITPSVGGCTMGIFMHDNK